MQTPAFKIDNLDGQVIQVGDQRKLAPMIRPIKLSLQGDRENFPTGYDFLKDQCLGMIIEDEWVCMQRPESDLTFEINQFGVYSLLFSPTDEAYEYKALSKTQFWLKHNKPSLNTIILVSLFVVVTGLLSILSQDTYQKSLIFSRSLNSAKQAPGPVK